MSDVSDMLYEFYKKGSKTKAAQHQQMPVMGAAAIAAAAAAANYVGQISPTSAETPEPSSKAVIATSSAAIETTTTVQQASFHPRIKVANFDSSNVTTAFTPTVMTAIPASAVAASQDLRSVRTLDIKPTINPATGLVITTIHNGLKPVPPTTSAKTNPQAAAIAAALIRDGYHSFQQQMRAQEIIKYHTAKLRRGSKKKNEDRTITTKILDNYLRQQRNSECDNAAAPNLNESDEDSRCNNFDDIQLMERQQTNFPQMQLNNLGDDSPSCSSATRNSASGTSGSGDFFSDESQKFTTLHAQAQAQALRNFEFSLRDFVPNNNSSAPAVVGPDGEPVFQCNRCGKKYRWKSTLRRHENVECGGKPPRHTCPYCVYKSKQRGNLGVHVRKHHPNLPQLRTKRRSKYSVQIEQISEENKEVVDEKYIDEKYVDEKYIDENDDDGNYTDIEEYENDNTYGSELDNSKNDAINDGSK